MRVCQYFNVTSKMSFSLYPGFIMYSPDRPCNSFKKCPIDALHHLHDVGLDMPKFLLVCNISCVQCLHCDIYNMGTGTSVMC